MSDAKGRKAVDWTRLVRDFAKAHTLPLFRKQAGLTHKHPVRTLDGRTWDEFPQGDHTLVRANSFNHHCQKSHESSNQQGT